MSQEVAHWHKHSVGLEPETCYRTRFATALIATAMMVVP